MRWLLALLGVLLLVWLASGDARAQVPPWDGQPETPPSGDIVSATFASPEPGVVGAWVTLDPNACGTARSLEARFVYAGQAYGAEVPLPPCPSGRVFVGRSVPAAPPGTAAVATEGFVLETSGSDVPLQRYPASDYLPMQAVAQGAPPLAALGWPGADVTVVAGLWGVAWWRDPSRSGCIASAVTGREGRVRASLSRDELGR